MNRKPKTGEVWTFTPTNRRYRPFRILIGRVTSKEIEFTEPDATETVQLAGVDREVWENMLANATVQVEEPKCPTNLN